MHLTKAEGKVVNSGKPARRSQYCRTKVGGSWLVPRAINE
jgi:hypothetical protein